MLQQHQVFVNSTCTPNAPCMRAPLTENLQNEKSIFKCKIAVLVRSTFVNHTPETSRPDRSQKKKNRAQKREEKERKRSKLVTEKKSAIMERHIDTVRDGERDRERARERNRANVDIIAMNPTLTRPRAHPRRAQTTSPHRRLSSLS